MYRTKSSHDETTLAALITRAYRQSSQVATVMMVSTLIAASGGAFAAVDSDNDGLSDIREAQLGTDPLKPDSDNDGLNDGREVTLGSNPLRTDSDGDSLIDGDEVNTYNTSPTESDSDFDTISDAAEIDIGTDPTIWDSDGGGIADGTEVLMGTNPLDGGDDVLDLDLDGDGIPNDAEGNSDFDGDGIPNQLDLDSDNDGIPDLIEAGGVDIDSNGVVDNPVDANGDGLADSVAATPLELLDTDSDDAPNFIDLDSDGDETFDLVEAGGSDADSDGTVDDFANDDADGNGLADSLTGASALPLTDSDGDGVADFLQNDDANATSPPDPTDPNDAGGPEIITGTSGHPLGCRLQSRSADGVDPILPSILAVLAALGFMRRRKPIP